MRLIGFLYCVQDTNTKLYCQTDSLTGYWDILENLFNTNCYIL